MTDVQSVQPNPEAQTELRRRVRAADTELPLLSAAGLAPSGRARLNREEIVRYAAIGVGPVGEPMLLGCLRAQELDRGGAPARDWPGGTLVEQLPWTVVETSPEFAAPTVEQRGRFVVVGREGQRDVVNIGIRQADGSYAWEALNTLQTGRAADVAFALKWGGSGAGNGQFRTPQGVAVDDLDGRVFVVDAGNHRLQVFDPTGAFLGTIGTFGSGNGQFGFPGGVAVDQATRDFYVAEYAGNRVQKFNASWAYQTKWGTAGSGNGQFNGPTGVAVDGAGNVWVADSGNHRVQKFSAAGGYLAQFGSAGGGAGQLNTPQGVAVDAAGNVWVADTLNHRVQKFSAAGAPLLTVGSYGNGDGQFNRPYWLAFDGDGALLVTDSNNGRVQKLAPDGTFLAKLGGYGSGDGQFNLPAGIAFAPARDAFYVAEAGGNRVQKFMIGSDGQVGYLADGQTAFSPNLTYDPATGRFGVGAAAPQATVHARGAGATVRAESSSGAALLEAWGAAGANAGVALYNGAALRWVLLNNAAGNALQIVDGATGLTRAQIDSAGNFYINGLAGTGNRAVSAAPAGNLFASSDARMKTAVRTLSGSLARLRRLRPVRYRWRQPARYGDHEEAGLIAQEVAPVVPEVVGTLADGTMTVNYPQLTALLIDAVQELAARVEALEGGALMAQTLTLHIPDDAMAARMVEAISATYGYDPKRHGDQTLFLERVLLVIAGDITVGYEEEKAAKAARKAEREKPGDPLRQALADLRAWVGAGPGAAGR